MEPWTVNIILVLGGLLIFGTTYLASVRMRLKHDRDLAEREAGRDELEQQLEELKALTQTQINELHERLDFSERLLAERRLPRPEESEAPTPV